MASIQRGEVNNELFAWVVKNYSEHLYWQVRRIVISHEDANDVMQNVMVKAWKALGGFRGECKLYSWLYRIAINESLSYIAKQRSQAFVSLDDSDSFLLNKLEGDPYIDGDETEIQLQKAIITLPEKQRIVFQMKYFEEMKYDQMSEILNTSVGALKASYHHAVKKIEDYFNKHD